MNILSMPSKDWIGLIRRIEVEKCAVCGKTEGLKRGWTNSLYCSKVCERGHVSDLHGSMPGAGPAPRPGWVPYHIAREIDLRWKED